MTMPDNEGFALAVAIPEKKRFKKKKGGSNSPCTIHSQTCSSAAVSVASRLHGGIPKVSSPHRRNSVVSVSPEQLKAKILNKQEQRLNRLTANKSKTMKLSVNK